MDTRWFTKEAAERGNQVHDRIRDYLLGDFNLEFNPEYEPYFQSFKKFHPMVKKVILVEERLADYELGFCGQPDLVCVYEDGIVTLVDWKTAQQKYKYWPIQLGGYSILLKTQLDIDVKKIMTVRLRKEFSKKPLIDVYSLEKFEKMFINMLDVYKYLK